MRPVSDRFLDSLRGSHRASVQAFVVAAGQTGTSPTGTEISIFGGDIQLDSTASIRGTLNLITDGDGSFPDNASDLFTPYGNEVFVRRGIAFGGGTIEWVSLGYFRIDSVEQDTAPDGSITLECQDRMAGIIEARLLAPVQYSATATYGDIVDDLIMEVYPWATVQWDDLTDTDAIGRSVISEDDRYKFLNDLITSVGKVWYWDHRGILVIKDVPDPDDPVWSVNAGENGVLVSLSRSLSREGVYNAVVASGEALDTEAPSRAVVVDNNPDSPTYYYGDFGKVPRFYSSPFITTDSQAQTAAASLLTQNLGLPYSVDLTSIPNPALEPLDPIAVNVIGTRNQTNVAALINDGFNRTVVDSWGTADSGQTWTANSDPAFFDVAATFGTIAITTANQARYNIVSGVDKTDVDGYMNVAAPSVATGSALVMSALTRYNNSGGHNGYSLAIEFDLLGAVACKIRKHVLGVVNEIASLNPIPGLTYSAGQIWRVRFRNSGLNLKIKVWPNGDSEPSSWTLETTDSTFADSGSVGVYMWRVGGNTNAGVQIRIYDYVANAYQSSNPGDEIHVIEKLTIPLMPSDAMKAQTREQTLVVIGDA